jgi:hypothetical protein
MQNDTTDAQTLPTTGEIASRIGSLEFEGGYPTSETLTRLYDEFDFQRAVQSYLWAVPLVSFAYWQEVYETMFGMQDGDLVLSGSFRDKLGILTANDTTPYLIGFVNLQRTGPLVIDYPRGQTAGGILDFWQRSITDMGLTGPDRGAGSKYLMIGPGQEIPPNVEGYHIVHSPMNNIMHGLRVLTSDPQEAEALTASYQVYPLAQRENPRPIRILSTEDKPWSGWPENGLLANPSKNAGRRAST